jgi:hypothetical protein
MRNIPYFLIILAVGLLVRFWPLSTLPFDSDQAIVGLMGKHILEGAFPWLYYGDPYSGILEPTLAAGAFLFLGINRTSLHLIPFIFSILFILSIYQLGNRLYNRAVGLMGMMLAALPPFYFGLYSAMAYGGYIEILWLGNLILLLSFTLADTRKPFPPGILFFLGLLWGIAWWTYPLAAIYLITSGLFLVLNRKEMVTRGQGIVPAAGFFIGSLPFWLWNGSNLFPFLRFTHSGPSAGLLHKISLLLANILQAFVLPIRNELAFLVPSAKVILIAGFIILLFFLTGVVGLAVGLIRRKAASWKSGADFLLLLFFVVFILLYTGTRFVESHDALRYLLPLYSLFPLSLGRFVHGLRKKNKVLGYGIFLFFLSFGLYHNLYLIYFYQTVEARYQRQVATELVLFDFLKARQIRYAYAPEYWSAAALNFNALEDPVFTLPFKDRYPLNTLRADAFSHPAFVLEGKYRQSFEAMVKSSGGSYRREIIAPFPKSKNFFVYYDFNPPGIEYQEILPDLWKGSSNASPTLVNQAFDRNASTAWSSLDPQKQGLYYQIDLGATYAVSHITLTPGRGRVWEFPGSYRIDLSLDGKDWQEAASVQNNWAYLFWSGGRLYWKLRNGRTELSFPPQKARFIRITLTDSSPSPWSIGEIFVYRWTGDLKTYSPSLEEILSTLKKENSPFFYADIGLSAQITERTGGNIKGLLEDYNITQGRDYSLWGYNGAFPYRSPLKNRIDFSLKPAFIIAKENNPAFMKFIQDAGASYRVKDLGDYQIYTDLKMAPLSGQVLNKIKSTYYWNGTHVLKSGPLETIGDEE